MINTPGNTASFTGWQDTDIGYRTSPICVLAWKNIGFVSLLIYKRRCWVVGAISTPDISQDDRQTSLRPITIVMKTLESRALLVVVAVAVAVANARSIHKEKYHGQEEEKAAAYI